MMTINDRIYGKEKITDPLVLEIIKSPSFLRLKSIAQFGPPDEFYHLKNFYRDEHCLGVMILLKRLGASREEQIAGLLHDISHTAFSHVVDWAIGNGIKESFQDDQHENFLKKSEVAGILKKAGINYSDTANYKHFTLLERDSPDLCADRVDYSLREFPIKIAKNCFKSLVNFKGRMVFKNKSSAKLFGENYLKVQKNHWGGFEAVSRYTIFGGLLRTALDKKIITMTDFWKTDKEVIEKIKTADDNDLNKVMEILRHKSLSYLPHSNNISYKKFRFVDPEFIDTNSVVHLSEVSKAFKGDLEQARVENKKGIKIPIT